MTPNDKERMRTMKAEQINPKSFKEPIARNGMPRQTNFKSQDDYDNAMDEYFAKINRRLEDILLYGAYIDPDIRETMLLYKPNIKGNSHISDHMLTDGQCTGKPDELIARAFDVMNDKEHAIDPNRKNAQSVFTDTDSAYENIITAIRKEFSQIESYSPRGKRTILTWLLNPDDKGSFAMTFNTSTDSKQKTHIGYGVRRDHANNIVPFETDVMTIVLHKNAPTPEDALGFNGMGFHVFTAYPGERDFEYVKTIKQKDIDLSKRNDISLDKIKNKSLSYKHASPLQKAFMDLQLDDTQAISDGVIVKYHDQGNFITIEDRRDREGHSISTKIQEGKNGLIVSTQARYNGKIDKSVTNPEPRNPNAHQQCTEFIIKQYKKLTTARTIGITEPVQTKQQNRTISFA